MSSTKKSPTKYSVGQKIVYPVQGVGEITQITKKPFQGQQTPYYVIYLSGSDMTVMIPCDKVDELGIRSVVSRQTATKALSKLEKPSPPLVSDWKLRYQNNVDLIKSGNLSDIATVVSALYFRSKQKELPILERKLFDNAKKLLIDELSLAMKKSVSDIEDLILTRLEEAAATANLSRLKGDEGDDLVDEELKDFEGDE